MKRSIVLAGAAAVLALSGCGEQPPGSSGKPVAGSGPLQLPVAFEQDGGRTGVARFQVHGAGGTLYLGDRGATFALGAGGGRQAAVGLTLPGARSGLRPLGERKLRGVVNSYVGDDRSKWRTGLRTFSQVRYDSVWPGIDLLFHGRRSALEYDFVIAPGADPSRVALRVGGHGRPRLDRDGHLVVATDAGRFVQRRPHAFQRVDGREVRVAGRFVLDGRIVRFAVGRYDRSRPLIIDPVILYSTFNGGSLDDEGYDVTLDGTQPIVVGRTQSTNFPTVSAADGTGDAANGDAFVTKLTADGTSRVFSTYLGGSGADRAYAVGVGSSGPATGLIGVAGSTASGNFPTAGATQAINAGGGSDAFASVLSATGALNFSTYYGGTGTDEAHAAIWYAGVRFTIGGETTSNALTWPGTPMDTTFGGATEGFVTQFVGPAPGFTINTGTYIGGSGADDVQDFAQDSSARLLLAGVTNSPFFIDGSALGDDAFVMRLGSTLSGNDLAKRHGGSGTEEDVDIAVDSANRPLVSGTTNSANLPTANAIDTTLSGANDGFLARYTSAGVLDTATYLGGSDVDGINSVAVAPNGIVWLAGFTGVSPNYDANIWRLAPTAQTLLSEQRLEGATNDALDIGTGVVIDSAGAAYVAGVTRSSDFPASGGAQMTHGGLSDAFVVKLVDPDTAITGGPSGEVSETTQAFTFEGVPNAAGLTFACQLDDGAYEACTSPKTYEGLSTGAHTFRVKAVDAQGVEDATPAERSFTVLAAPTTTEPTPTTTEPTTTEPPPGPVAPTASRVTGPDRLTLGQTGVFGAVVEGAVDRYDWDVDGDSKGTGASPSIPLSFDTPGRHTVRVRATGPGGAAEATKTVTVDQLVVPTLEYEPAFPKPGEKIRFKLASPDEPTGKPLYYAWKLEGLKPLDRTLRIKRPGKSRGVSRAARGGSYEIKLKDAQPTAVPRLSREFPKTGSHDVDLTVAKADGTTTIVQTVVQVVSNNYDPLGQQISKDTIHDCKATLPAGCGAIVAPKTTGIGEVTTISDASPALEFCVEGPDGSQPVAKKDFVSRYTSKLNLPYPADSFYDAGAGPVAADAVGPVTNGQAAAGARAAGRGTKEFCRGIGETTVSWKFGDGEEVQPSPVDTGGAAPEPWQLPYAPANVEHVYKAKGTYTITNVNRRWYLSFPDPDKDPEGWDEATQLYIKAAIGEFEESVRELIAKGYVRSYQVRTTRKISVVNRYCKPVRLNGIEALAVVLDDEAQCFEIPDSAKIKDGVPTELTLFPGSFLSLNGISVKGVMRIDTTKARINTLNFDPLVLTFSAGTHSYPAGSTPVIRVPKPSFDAEVGQEVAVLPPYKGAELGPQAGEKLNGFTVRSSRTLLSPDTSAYIRVTLDPLEPIRETTPVVIIGGSKTQTRGVGAPDFSLDLGGANLGLFRAKSFLIEHYPGGEDPGWEGGGEFEFDLGGETYELAAPFLERGTGTPERCEDYGDTVGPSGLKISDKKGFQHVGARLTARVPIGPLVIDCFAANFTAKPFRLVGAIAAQVGKGDFLSIDACVMFAIMQKGEVGYPCFIDPDNPFDSFPYVAEKDDEYWIDGRGSLSLKGELDLGSAGFDIHAAKDLLNFYAFGSMSTWYGPFHIKAFVDGLIKVKPKAAFQFRAQGEIALHGCPACASLKGMVSSKGVGACVDVIVLSGGFVYRWGGDVDTFGGCGWDHFSSISIRSTPTSLTDLRADPGTRAALGAVAKHTFEVRGARRPLEVEIAGNAAEAPHVTLSGPDRTRLVGPTKPGFYRVAADGSLISGRAALVAQPGLVKRPSFTVQEPPIEDGIPRAGSGGRGQPMPLETIVTLPQAKPGSWTVETQDGSTAMTAVVTREKLPTRHVDAEVPRSDKRTLHYVVTPIEGQSVEFVDESRARVPTARGRQPDRGTVGRTIGHVEAGDDPEGDIPFPAGYGEKGPRQIRAIISQGGIPVEDFIVDKYEAPGPPSVTKPDDVAVKRVSQNRAEVCWKHEENDANAYEIRATTSDGRKLVRRAGGDRSEGRRFSSRPCVKLPGFDEWVGATFEVRTVTPYGVSKKSEGKLSGRHLDKTPTLVL